MVSWPFECPSNFTYSFNVALSRKEVTWILKSTKSPNGGKSSLLGMLHKAISCVKLASSLMTYGNIWFWNYKRKQNVSWFLVRLLTIGSGYLSKLHSGIYECSVRISALDCCQSTHLIAVSVTTQSSWPDLTVIGTRGNLVFFPHLLLEAPVKDFRRVICKGAQRDIVQV